MLELCIVTYGVIALKFDFFSYLGRRRLVLAFLRLVVVGLRGVVMRFSDGIDIIIGMVVRR